MENLSGFVREVRKSPKEEEPQISPALKEKKDEKKEEKEEKKREKREEEEVRGKEENYDPAEKKNTAKIAI